MPEGLRIKRAQAGRLRPQTVVLWLLSLAVLVLFVANIREKQRTDALTVALATYRQDSERQITELHQAQSASLEQGLLRLDEMTSALQKTEQDVQRQTQSMTSRMRSEFARTVEQRHQEMIRAISDLRADLRAVSARPNPNNDVEKPHEVATRPAATLTALTGAAISQTPAADAATKTERHEDPAAATLKKKTFWSKLNPFSRKKKPQDSTPDGVAQ